MGRQEKGRFLGATVLSCFVFGATSVLLGVIRLFLGHVSWIGIVLAVITVEKSASLASGKYSAADWLLLLMLLYAGVCAYPIADLILHSPEQLAELRFAVIWAAIWGLWACVNLFLLVRLRRRVGHRAGEGLT